jgi:shikimate kinase
MTGDTTTTTRRPALTDQAPLTEIVQLLAEREPMYREASDFSVDTENRPPDEIVKEILRRLDWKAS